MLFNLESENHNLSSSTLKNINELIEMLKTIINDSLPKYIQNLPIQFKELYDYESQNPNKFAIEILDSNCPNILNFTAEDRDLKSEYNLEKKEYPKALRNLYTLAN